MNDLVSINGRAIERITYRDTPVITLPMVDELHERKKNTAGQNFRANKKRFIEAEDYFLVPQDEWNNVLRQRNSMSQDGNQHGGYRGEMVFLTETGYLMLVKSFTDDLSWQIQRQLVKTYFAARALVNQQAGHLPVQTKVTVNTSDLVRESHKGNRFAQRLLHHLTGMQVDDLSIEIAHQIEVEDFRRAELAAQYFDLLYSQPETFGIVTGRSDDGHDYLQAVPTQFFNVFRDLGKKYHLPMLAKDVNQFGVLLSKEAAALEHYGWRRSLGKVSRGARYFRFEKVGG